MIVVMITMKVTITVFDNDNLVIGCCRKYVYNWNRGNFTSDLLCLQLRNFHFFYSGNDNFLSLAGLWMSLLHLLLPLVPVRFLFCVFIVITLSSHWWTSSMELQKWAAALYERKCWNCSHSSSSFTSDCKQLKQVTVLSLCLNSPFCSTVPERPQNTVYINKTVHVN